MTAITPNEDPKPRPGKRLTILRPAAADPVSAEQIAYEIDQAWAMKDAA